MEKRLPKTFTCYAAPVLMLWFMLLLNQLPAYMAQSTMNLAQIKDAALKSSAAVKNASFQQFKAMFKEYAPDTWVTAMNEIPIQTIQCMIKIGKRVALKVQNNMTTEPSVAQMTNKLRKNCRHGYPKVAAFEAAINKTMQQLPQSVKDIGTQFSSQLKQLSAYLENRDFASASPIGVKFLQSVGNISMADRQQLGTLFPKLSNVFVDPRVDDLINMTILFLNGNAGLMKNASKLAQEIVFGGLRKASNNTTTMTNSTSTSQAKMMSPKEDTSPNSAYFDAPKAFDQPQEEGMSNGAVKMLDVLKGNDSQDGLIEPIAHDDAKLKPVGETGKQQTISLDVLPIGSVGVLTQPASGSVNVNPAAGKPGEQVNSLPEPPAVTA